MRNSDIYPGDVDEKTEPFMMSFYYNMEQIIGKQRLDVLRDTGVIKVIPLAYMRGLTLTNTCVILDEAQNTLPNSNQDLFNTYWSRK